MNNVVVIVDDGLELFLCVAAAAADELTLKDNPGDSVGVWLVDDDTAVFVAVVTRLVVVVGGGVAGVVAIGRELVAL